MGRRRKPVSIAKALTSLKAHIERVPGVTWDELQVLGYVNAGLAGSAKLSTLIGNGSVIKIRGGYYPATPEYLALKHPQAAATAAKPIDSGLKVWTVPVPQIPEPQIQEKKVMPVELSEAPAIEPPQSPPVDSGNELRSKEEQRCLKAIAELEAKGVPFNYSQVQSLAGLGKSYLSCNPAMREAANAAIARCGGTPPRPNKTSQQIKRTQAVKTRRSPRTVAASPRQAQAEPVLSVHQKWTRRLQAAEHRAGDLEAQLRACQAEVALCREFLQDLSQGGLDG